MTELLIDGKPVSLPKGLDLKIKAQNPIITKNGTFTLDLSLSLKERSNAILYKHIDRLQSAAVIDGRSAMLISDGKIILNGSEAYISNTNEEVKIQLLSGNSELNYFIGSDLYISDLDLGSETDLSNTRLNQVIKKTYPEVSFNVPMVKIGSALFNAHEETTGDISVGSSYNFTNISIQPYLLAMLEKIISALGYTISYNEIRSDKLFSKCIILNDNKSGEYSKTLQGWKVIDFLEECEKFMNIVFDIDVKEKKVKILSAGKRNTFGTYSITNVLDSFERTASELNADLSYLNVKYDFPSSTEYRFQDVEQDVLDVASLNTSNTFAEMASKLFVNGTIPEAVGEEYYKGKILFYVTETDTYYIVDRMTPASSTGATFWYYFKKVHTFRKHMANEGDEYLELKFFPALNYWYSIKSDRPGSDFKRILIPYLPGSSEEESEGSSLKSLIENGITDFNSTKKNIALTCFYKADPAYETSNDNVEDSITWYAWYDTNYATFRLEGPEGLFNRHYANNNGIDTTKEYTIKFLSREIPDVQAEFLFNNKLFVCKELEYRVTNEGIHPVITGTFYPVVN